MPDRRVQPFTRLGDEAPTQPFRPLYRDERRHPLGPAIIALVALVCLALMVTGVVVATGAGLHRFRGQLVGPSAPAVDPGLAACARYTEPVEPTRGEADALIWQLRKSSHIDLRAAGVQLGEVTNADQAYRARHALALACAVHGITIRETGRP